MEDLNYYIANYNKAEDRIIAACYRTGNFLKYYIYAPKGGVERRSQYQRRRTKIYKRLADDGYNRRGAVEEIYGNKVIVNISHVDDEIINQLKQQTYIFHSDQQITNTQSQTITSSDDRDDEDSNREDTINNNSRDISSVIDDVIPLTSENTGITTAADDNNDGISTAADSNDSGGNFDLYLEDNANTTNNVPSKSTRYNLRKSNRNITYHNSDDDTTADGTTATAGDDTIVNVPIRRSKRRNNNQISDTQNIQEEVYNHLMKDETRNKDALEKMVTGKQAMRKAPPLEFIPTVIKTINKGSGITKLTIDVTDCLYTKILPKPQEDNNSSLETACNIDQRIYTVIREYKKNPNLHMKLESRMYTNTASIKRTLILVGEEPSPPKQKQGTLKTVICNCVPYNTITLKCRDIGGKRVYVDADNVLPCSVQLNDKDNRIRYYQYALVEDYLTDSEIESYLQVAKQYNITSLPAIILLGIRIKQKIVKVNNNINAENELDSNNRNKSNFREDLKFIERFFRRLKELCIVHADKLSVSMLNRWSWIAWSETKGDMDKLYQTEVAKVRQGIRNRIDESSKKNSLIYTTAVSIVHSMQSHDNKTRIMSHKICHQLPNAESFAQLLYGRSFDELFRILCTIFIDGKDGLDSSRAIAQLQLVFEMLVSKQGDFKTDHTLRYLYQVQFKKQALINNEVINDIKDFCGVAPDTHVIRFLVLYFITGGKRGVRNKPIPKEFKPTPNEVMQAMSYCRLLSKDVAVFVNELLGQIAQWYSSSSDSSSRVYIDAILNDLGELDDGYECIIKGWR